MPDSHSTLKTPILTYAFPKVGAERFKQFAHDHTFSSEILKQAIELQSTLTSPKEYPTPFLPGDFPGAKGKPGFLSRTPLFPHSFYH